MDEQTKKIEIYCVQCGRELTDKGGMYDSNTDITYCTRNSVKEASCAEMAAFSTGRPIMTTHKTPEELQAIRANGGLSD